ncbi:hypothetical protein, partial [Staphylococcus aureus]|uniref:hypothetical protein n=1 Tax=Staphylococcus aureus TaxID=1280 RepID=UPI001C92EDCC
LLGMACLLKIKRESLKVRFLRVKIGNIRKLMMNLYVVIRKQYLLKHIHTLIIHILLNLTSTYINPITLHHLLSRNNPSNQIPNPITKSSTIIIPNTLNPKLIKTFLNHKPKKSILKQKFIYTLFFHLSTLFSLSLQSHFHQ